MSVGIVALGARQVEKHFDGIVALDGVDFQVRKNESVALIGANGAGKSTLVRLLTGASLPDKGEIVVDGIVTNLRSVVDARHRGIGFIPQELCIAPDLTVAENVLISGWAKRGLRIAQDEELEKVDRVCKLVGLDASPTSSVLRLNPTEQRLVMIARSLVAKPTTLILDEPTAALADKEADRIVEVLNELRRSGLSMVYISHRMGEISRVCDSIVALRNGKVVWSGQADAESVRQAIATSINRSGKSEENTIQAGPRKTVDSDIALECLGLTNSRLTDVSLRVSSGEVVGLCGLLGSGRSEILRAISGADSVSSGQICVSGKNVEMKSPSHSVSHGVGLLPEDRRNQGALLGLSVMDNLTLPRIPNRRGFLRPALEKLVSDESIQNFGIRCQSITDLLSTLSGGNQQKVILARWMLAGVKVLLLDEPTAGIDVVAKKELLDAVHKKTEEGLAVLLASSDLDDLVRYCDRIYIVRDGKIVHEIVGQVTAEELTEWCNKRLD